MEKDKLDEHIEIAEKLFLLSEEIRDMVNTFDLVEGRRCIINAVVEAIDAYKIEQYEMDEARDPVLTDFENMTF